jgi:hypothetical protein
MGRSLFDNTPNHFRAESVRRYSTRFVDGTEDSAVRQRRTAVLRSVKRVTASTAGNWFQIAIKRFIGRVLVRSHNSIRARSTVSVIKQLYQNSTSFVERSSIKGALPLEPETKQDCGPGNSLQLPIYRRIGRCGPAKGPLSVLLFCIEKRLGLRASPRGV